MRTLGLYDESNKEVSLERRAEIMRDVFALLDTNSDGRVDKDEFEHFIASGRTLPDYGTGPGHHGDDEYEYEIHHWEK
jgi:Ca2+-binding EF-hand superfamily protein